MGAADQLTQDERRPRVAEHVDGRRTVYIPVTKRSDASTLAVIRAVRDAMLDMRALVPEDVDIQLEFRDLRLTATVSADPLSTPATSVATGGTLSMSAVDSAAVARPAASARRTSCWRARRRQSSCILVQSIAALRSLRK